MRNLPQVMQSLLLSQQNGCEASSQLRRQGLGRDFILRDIWTSILVSGDAEISLERKKERTEKPLELLEETKTVTELGDSWDVGGGSWRE